MRARNSGRFARSIEGRLESIVIRYKCGATLKAARVIEAVALQRGAAMQRKHR
jgi:hypothetical protein